MRLYRHLCHRVSAILLLAVLVWPCCTPTAVPSSPATPFFPTPTQNLPSADLYSVAAEHIAAGEFTAAEKLYAQAWQDFPNDPHPALGLARLYAKWKRPQAGLNALDEAVRRNATPEEIGTLRLELLAMSGNWTQLAAEAEARLTAIPNDRDALEWLTQAYLQTYQCSLATTAVRRWQEVAPQDPQARFSWDALGGNVLSLCENDARFCIIPSSGDDLQLGLLLIRAEKWGLAACVLTRAVAADETLADAHLWLGEALERIGRFAEAQEHLQQATQLAPQKPLPWLLLGLHHLNRQQSSAAADALMRARTLDPTNPLIYLSMATAKAQVGDYAAVDVWIGAALDVAPTDPDIAKAAARFYLERHLVNAEYPIRPIQSAIQLTPQDGEAYMFLGWLRLMTGDLDGAGKALDKAIAYAPTLGQAHYLRGLVLQATQDPVAAQVAFTRAADLGYWP